MDCGHVCYVSSWQAEHTACRGSCCAEGAHQPLQAQGEPIFTQISWMDVQNICPNVLVSLLHSFWCVHEQFAIDLAVVYEVMYVARFRTKHGSQDIVCWCLIDLSTVAIASTSCTLLSFHSPA